MSCQHARRLLSDRLDGPLSPPEAAALAAHLRTCAACSRHEAQLQARMWRIARLPDLPLPAPAARSARPRAASPLVAWLTRGGQVALAVLAVLLVARLTADLLRPRAERAERPESTEVIMPYGGGTGQGAAFSSGAIANSAPAPAANAAPAANTTSSTANAAFTAPNAPRPIVYARAWSLGEQDQLWGEVASEHGEAIGAILRPGYLPEGLQRVQVGQIAGEAGHFSVSFSGEGPRLVRITAGLQPEQLYPAETIAAAPSTPATVRGQAAPLLGPFGSEGDVTIAWEERGRWAKHGGMLGADRIPYTLTIQGYERAEIERIAASLAPQLTAPNAADLVRRYYSAINARDYRAAYDLIEPPWSQTYDDFVTGFADTTHDEIDVLGVIAANAPGRYFVQIRLRADQATGGHRWYSGTYEIGGAPGAARILGADIGALTEGEAAQLAPKGPPLCARAQIGLVLRPQLIENNQLVDILVGLTNESIPCRLETPLTVTITATDGQLLRLEGNDLTLTMNGAIGTFNLGVGFGWTNWCDAPGPFFLRVTLGDATAFSSIPQPPSCTDPGKPSRLEWR